MRKAFLTYAFGGYDRIEDPSLVTPGWRYICVGDQHIDSRVWEFRKAPDRLLAATDCPKRRSSLTKIHHQEFLPEDYDILMCGDACLGIHCDLDSFLEEFLPPGAELSVARHWGRDCVYDEAEAVVNLRLDDPHLVGTQMKQYMAQGFPRGRGLYANRVVIKDLRSLRLRRFLEIWSEAYKAGSRRDQLSMTYALWVSEREEGQPLRVHGFDFEEVFRRRRLFTIRPHLLSREWPSLAEPPMDPENQ